MRVKGNLGVLNRLLCDFWLVLKLGGIRLNRLKRADYTEFALLRRRGSPERNLPAVKGSTVDNDLQYIRSLLKHAHFMWGLDVSWNELDMAMEGLRRSRLIDKGEERMRLPTRDELLALTRYFWQQKTTLS